MESQDTQGQEAQSQSKEGGHLRPENIKAYALEEDTSDDDQKIPQGIEISNILDNPRHIINWKHET